MKTSKLNAVVKSIKNKHPELKLYFVSGKKMLQYGGSGFGFYNNDDKLICIQQAVPNYIKLYALFHELGHHLCYKNGCACCSNCSKSEMHANLFALRQLILENETDALSNFVEQIEQGAMMFDRDKIRGVLYHYYAGCKEIMKTSLWRKCRSKIRYSKRHRQRIKAMKQFLGKHMDPFLRKNVGAL